MRKNIDARVTFLADVNGHGANLEVRDNTSGVMFLAVNFNAEQFCQLLGRLGYVRPDTAFVQNLDRVGKRHETRELYAPLTKDIDFIDIERREKEARDAIIAWCPPGWTPNLERLYRDNFVRPEGEDGTPYVRTSIHRWVDDAEQTAEQTDQTDTENA